MIFLKLFIVFSKIGIVNFGGGYAMISLIQSEVVTRYHWLTSTEFTDILGISQMTPGPIGVNVATYVGYNAVVSAGYSPFWGVIGSIIATLSVLWLPFILMIILSRYLLKHKDSIIVKSIFMFIRPVVVGLIAYAALVLMNSSNFGSLDNEHILQLVVSVSIFILTFIATYKYKFNIFIMLGLSALSGIIIYH